MPCDVALRPAAGIFVVGACIFATVCGTATAGCNDRTAGPEPIVFDPNAMTADVGVDAADTRPPPAPDEFCDGEPDGVGCERQNTAGVCVRQQCRLVACLSGFADCDDEPGCETDLGSPTSCGGCDVICESEQQCREGPDGFVCAAGAVCPTDRFDLDGDADNGCEWRAEWEPAFTVVPQGLRIDAVRWKDGVRVAGTSDGKRVSVLLGDTPQPTVWENAPAEDAFAVDVRGDNRIERVVWSDGVSSREDGISTFTAPPCEQGLVPREFVDATDGFVASQFDVFRVDRTCADGFCLQPVYGPADYLADFLAHPAAPPDDLAFDESEVVRCDRCLFDDVGDPAFDVGCFGPEQCRPDDFDDAVCGTCEPTGCPEFAVVGLAETTSLLFVVTQRGAIVLDRATLEPIARLESAFDPDTSGGPRYVASRSEVRDDGMSLLLLHSSGEIRRVDVESVDGSAVSMTPRPPLGLDVDVATTSIAGKDPLVGLVADEEARVLLPLGASARSAFLTMESAPGVQGLAPTIALRSPNGLRFFYAAAGQLFPRRLVRDEP